MAIIASSTIYKKYKTYQTYKPKIIVASVSSIESSVMDIICKTKEEAVELAQMAINEGNY